MRTLGLNPEALLWVYDGHRETFVLWFVWSGIDEVGPLPVAELLFKAYRGSALTHAVDPFLVDLRSPNDAMVQKLVVSFAKSDATVLRLGTVEEDDGRSRPTHHIDKSWVLHLQEKRQPSLSVSKDWRQFSERVSAIAA